MAVIKFDALDGAEVNPYPFEFFCAQNLLSEKDLHAVRADFPAIEKPGIFPLSSLEYGPAFKALIEDIESVTLRKIIAKKFGINLSGLPLMITIRGRAQLKDGRIHTDTKDKVVTCLFYLNEEWDVSGGRLRLLHNPDNIANFSAEIRPNGGTMAGFRISDRSWHGHEPYVGERRYVMFNWLKSEAALTRQIGRHKFSAKVKKLIPSFYRDM